MTDYRKQKVPAGVYTLRLALQPVSDDHGGTAPYRDFCLLSPAADDRKPDLLSPKALHALMPASPTTIPRFWCCSRARAAQRRNWSRSQAAIRCCWRRSPPRRTRARPPCSWA